MLIETLMEELESHTAPSCATIYTTLGAESNFMQSKACLCNRKTFSQRQENAESIHIEVYIYICNSQRLANTHSFNACGYKGLLICQHKHPLNKYSSRTFLHLTVGCWGSLRSWLAWSTWLVGSSTSSGEHCWSDTPAQNCLSSYCHVHLCWWWARGLLHSPVGLQQRPLKPLCFFSSEPPFPHP